MFTYFYSDIHFLDEYCTVTRRGRILSLRVLLFLLTFTSFACMCALQHSFSNNLVKTCSHLFTKLITYHTWCLQIWVIFKFLYWIACTTSYCETEDWWKLLAFIGVFDYVTCIFKIYLFPLCCNLFFCFFQFMRLANLALICLRVWETKWW